MMFKRPCECEISKNNFLLQLPLGWFGVMPGLQNLVKEFQNRLLISYRFRSRPHNTVFVWKRYCFVGFSKRFASTLIVFVSFSPVHTTTRIRIENALKPYILLYYSDKKWNLKASVCHLGYSRLSGLQPGRVVVVMSSFSDSIVFAVHTMKTTFSNSTVFKSFQCKPMSKMLQTRKRELFRLGHRRNVSRDNWKGEGGWKARPGRHVRAMFPRETISPHTHRTMQTYCILVTALLCWSSLFLKITCVLSLKYRQFHRILFFLLLTFGICLLREILISFYD